MAKQQPERQLHKLVSAYLSGALPSDALFFPVPSASLRTPRQAGAMRRAGEIIRGVPDLIIVYKGRIIGLELKAPKGRLSPEQKAFHDRLTLSGAVVFVAKSLDDVYGFLSQIVPLKARPQ